MALERSGRPLRRVAQVFHNLTAAHQPGAAAAGGGDGAAAGGAPDTLFLDVRSVERVHHLYQRRDQLSLDPESAWLLERYHTDFVRAGVLLRPADQQRLRELNQRISELLAKFDNRLRSDTNDLAVTVDDPARLAGLSADAVAAAAAAAKERGRDGHVLTLILPTDQPALASLHDRALREEIHRAAISRGARGNEHDTQELVREIVRLRAERAALLGYSHHAAYRIAEGTAGSVAAVEEMLAQLVPPAVANVRTELAALREVAARMGRSSPSAVGLVLLRRAVAGNATRWTPPRYVPTSGWTGCSPTGCSSPPSGCTDCASRSGPTCPPTTRRCGCIEVFDADGSALGLFLADFFTRDSKRGGAWQSTFQGQSHLLGTRPVVVVNLNLNRPPDGEPALLTVDEVRTLFHEFGHALHSLFSDVRYPRFAGTAVPRDFVEYPSQVNEVWMLWPEVLANYARHYETGEPLPQEMIERLRRAETFNQGSPPPSTSPPRCSTWPGTALTGRRRSHRRAGVRGRRRWPRPAWAAARCRRATAAPTSPTSSRGGYSAGYYSYIWSEVLDADTVEWFREHGGLTRQNGDRFRRTVLSRGGSTDPMEAFREFRGRDPRIEPLLIRRGLTGSR